MRAINAKSTRFGSLVRSQVLVGSGNVCPNYKLATSVAVGGRQSNLSEQWKVQGDDVCEFGRNVSLLTLYFVTGTGKDKNHTHPFPFSCLPPTNTERKKSILSEQWKVEGDDVCEL
jgi:hypothetical protein